MSMLKYTLVAVLLSAVATPLRTSDKKADQTSALEAGDDSCPKISVKQDFNLTEYTRASWYIQEQQVNGYQPKSELFCVTATYNHTNKHVPFFSGPVIGVHNYANKDKVNGASTGGELCARQPDTSVPAKLEVAPCFLPNFLAGPYWVVLAGPQSDNYEWAVVSGGQPKVRVSNTTCTTTEKGINGAGLWVFSRSNTMTNSTKTRIHEMMLQKGLATSKLVTVPHQGCNYAGAFIKPNNQ